jgi:predicted nucleotidyltransferase
MIEQFLSAVVRWASARRDIRAVALVGSHARGTATSTSDIDLVILTTRPGSYLDDTGWAAMFGTVARQQTEDWGTVTSLRVWYEDGREVEFGITTPEWAAQPLDEGTRQVVSDGIRILFDRGECLASAMAAESGRALLRRIE